MGEVGIFRWAFDGCKENRGVGSRGSKATSHLRPSGDGLKRGRGGPSVRQPGKMTLQYVSPIS